MTSNAHTPLLSNAGNHNALYALPSRAAMTYELLQQSTPLMAKFILYVSYNLIQLHYASFYSSQSTTNATLIAAISLSNLFANVSCLSILFGMGSVVETLGAQYNGAKMYREVGLTLQRSLLILSCIAVSLCPLWFYGESLFDFFGIEPKVCTVIGELLTIRILSLPIDVIRESYTAYCLALGLMIPSFIGLLSLNILLLLFNHICVSLGYSYIFLAWSFMAATYLSMVIEIRWSWYHPLVVNTMQAPDYEALTNWEQFIDLGIPSTLQVCAEWWAYEVLTLFAASLGTTAVDSQAIIFQFVVLCFMIPLGIQIALTSLVGNAIGDGNSKLAKAIAWNSLAVGFGIQLLVGLAVYFLGGYFMYYFSTDETISAVTVSAVPLIAYYTVIDGMQGIAAGILKGAGKQKLGAYLNLVAYYAVGLPLAWVCCFHLDLGVYGLIFGMSFGSIFEVLVMFYILIFLDSQIFTAYIELK